MKYTLFPPLIWFIGCVASFLVRPIAHELYDGTNLLSLNDNLMWIVGGFIFTIISIALAIYIQLRGENKLLFYIHAYFLNFLGIIYFTWVFLDLIVDHLGPK